MLAAHHRPNNPTGKRLGLPHSHFEKTQLTDSTIYNVQPLKNRRFSSPVAKDGLGVKLGVLNIDTTGFSHFHPLRRCLECKFDTHVEDPILQLACDPFE